MPNPNPNILLQCSVYASLDSNICCDIAYFDFEKAFDTIPHSELLLKLWIIGITRPLHVAMVLHYVNNSR